MQRQKRRFRDSRWAWRQVYRGDVEVGKPVFAVSDAQAIHVILERFGDDQSGKWHAKLTNQTLGERRRTKIARLYKFAAHPAACPECTYLDPSRGIVSRCPNCDASR
jgi:predicted Zn-ribbon and HTH transcriptional regulator